MATLRRARQEAALLVALADLGGVWDVVAGDGGADRLRRCGGRRRRALPARARRAPPAQIELADPTSPTAGSGWIILGMGKFGAGELNYSSDIDLIVLFDREVATLAEDSEPARLFVRLTKRLVAHPPGAHRRRLRLPHRPPPAPRSRRDQHRHLDRGGAAILREPRPELGARRADQGAAGRRRHRGGRGLPRASSPPTSGANISTTPRSPTSTRSSARSTTIAATARSPSPATTSSSAAAASARSSSSSRPSS